MSISVTYIYSACIVIRTPDVRILCDPWFTQGVYDGAWHQFPQVQDPLASIGDVDKIYISHLHPDHYDAAFLRRYFERYGEKEILIADHQPNHMAFKMKADGLAGTVLAEPRVTGETTIEIWPHRTGSASDIDSALMVRYDDGTRRHCVANTNDIIFDDAMIDTFTRQAGAVDILCCGYTGAGPFPQTYFDIDDPRLPEMAVEKKARFFERYQRLVQAVSAKRNLPFAGKYILGGKLAPLNAWRGVADPVEVLAFDDRAVVLADAGGTIDTATLTPSAVRTTPYDSAALAARIAEISGETMDYERLINSEEVHQLPIRRLLALAARRAFQRSECDKDYHFIIPVPGEAFPGGEVAILNINKANPSLTFAANNGAYPEPWSCLEIDPRYLFGLLTNIYHWNNAEVGSQYQTRRQPNVLNRAAQRFLNNLAVG